MILPSSATGAVVVDANILISRTAKEATEPKTSAEIARYSQLGYEFFAPGVIVAETLYVLCGKLNDGSLSVTEHALAVQKLDLILKNVSPPPNGDVSLLLRAEVLRGSYSCRRSADGLYIALAEQLSQLRPTVLLTYDDSMSKHALRHAPKVTVQLLTA